MSIKGYVFMLFGALILLLGMSQLAMTRYFKSQLQAELQQTSKALSHDIVNVVIERAANTKNWRVPEPPKPGSSPSVDVIRSLENLSRPEVIAPDTQVGAIDDSAVEMDIANNDSDIDNNTDNNNDNNNPTFDSDSTASDMAYHDNQMIEDEIASLNDEIQKISDEIQEAAPRGEISQWDERRFQALQDELNTKVKAMLEKQKVSLVAEQREMVLVCQQAAKEYEQRMREALSSLDVKTEHWLNEGRVMIVDDGGPISITRTDSVQLSNQGANSVLDRFDESLLLLILASSVLAMLLAYWLSHHVSQPLTALAKGHQRLGQGEFGVQLTEQGVTELKLILRGFNAMSIQLAKWSEQATLMSQQQHLADLGQVARGIAHSLRNPLQTLGLLSEQSAATADADKRHALDAKVQQKIALMDKNIQALLTLASDAVNRTHLVPMNAIIQDILLEVSIGGCPQKVEFVQCEHGFEFAGAESELRSILHAVIVNALEAGPLAEKVLIQCEQDAQYCYISVTDWGAGIDENVRSQLFDPHVTTKAEGSGMGLYLAKRLIAGHYGGDILLEDNPEGGTIVRLVFAKHRDVISL